MPYAVVHFRLKTRDPGFLRVIVFFVFEKCRSLLGVKDHLKVISVIRTFMFFMWIVDSLDISASSAKLES